MTTNGRTKDGNNPRSVQRFERAILIGIPSADFIKASGHSTARQAGHMEATDQVISTSKKPLPAGAIHIWTPPEEEDAKRPHREREGLVHEERDVRRRQAQSGLCVSGGCILLKSGV
jgi:hypothetical protein